MKRYLLGIDIGTTGAKALLCGEDGSIAASAYREYGMAMPHHSWREQNAEDWWTAVTELIRTVCRDREKASGITAVSFSAQGGTVVPTDGAFRPLGPARVWSDRRCTPEEVDRFRAAFPGDEIYRTTGWYISGGLPALQLAWMRDHEPEIFEKARWFLTVPDYISAKLTGRPVVDISDAGINQLTDIRRMQYDERILSWIGVEPSRLPEIRPSASEIGTILPEVAAALGLPEKVTVVTGAHDQYAVAAGAGLGESGCALIGSGTAWAVTVLTDRPHFESGASQSVSASPGKWGTVASIPSGGVCLEWFRRQLSDGTEPMAYDRINERVAEKPVGAGGLRFYPYLNGSGYPRMSKEARGALQGIDLSHDRFDIARAVMEGVSFQSDWILDSLRACYPIHTLKFSGGAAKSGIWVQILADITGMPVRVARMPELACLGACILAGVGTQVFADVGEGYRRLSVPERVVEPIPEHNRQYRAAAEGYRAHAATLF